MGGGGGRREEGSGKQQNEMRPPRKLQINIQYNMHDPKLSIWPEEEEEESTHTPAETPAEAEAEAELLLLWAKAMNLRARNAIVEWE